MNVGYALQFLVGDYGRFGHLADRVEGLVEVQVKGFHQGKSQWLVLPWIGGFTCSLRMVKDSAVDARSSRHFSAQRWQR